MRFLNSANLNFVFEPRKIEMDDIIHSQSFRDYCTEIFKDSQVNGINQIASAKSVVRKIIKAVVFLGCLTGFLYQAISFFNHFQEYPSVLSTDLQFADYLDFPAISICHNTRLRRSSICPRDPEFCAENLQCDGIIADYVISDYVTSRHPKEIINVSPFYDDFIHCKTHGLVSFTESIGHICDHIERVYSADYPSCFSFNARWNYPNVSGIQVREGQKLTLDLRFFPNQSTEWDREIGASVVVGSVFDLPFAHEGIAVRPGYKYRITFKQVTKISLPAPYPTNCTDYVQQRIEYSGVKPLTWKMCVHDCVLEKSMDLCQCISSWMPITMFDKYPYCRTKNVEQMYCLERKIPPARRQCELLCKQECLVRIYDVKVAEHRHPTNKILAYNESYWKAWSYVGGYVGIWLGVSLVAFCDFLENIIIICQYAYSKNIKGKLSNKIRENMAKAYQHIVSKISYDSN